MRLVGIDSVTEGMTLGRTIYNLNAGVLLSAGIALNAKLIKRVKKLGIPAVYINDEFTKDIIVEDVISPELRHQFVDKMKGFFTAKDDMSKQQMSSFKKEAARLISDIMHQVLSNKDVVVSLTDLKTHDDYTYQHSVNVGVLCAVTGAELGYSESELKDLVTAGIFHDIGKKLIDSEVLNKPDKLTPEEFDAVKKHTVLGYEFAYENLEFSATVLNAILLHHEKYDGTGYPYGKQGNGISDFARIVSVCDVFDAMTSKRVYHKALLPSEAIEYIMASGGTHFAPEISNAFVKKVSAYPVGIEVVLSNGKKGIVSKNTEGMTLRPEIKLFEGETLDLALPQNHRITITSVVEHA